VQDYSGYLICSDYDGTLNYDGVHICEENVRAIHRFLEGGGRFTLCTGRDGGQFAAQTQLPFALNAPLAALTGAQIYDVSANRAVEERFLEPGWPDILEDIITQIPRQQTIVVVGRDFEITVESTDREAVRRLCDTVGDRPVFKIVSFNGYPGPELFLPEAKAICENRCNITANGQGSFELTHLGVNKGYGALRVKELTGARFLICAGDFAGDIDMLRVADRSYAVGNAAQAVKAAADRVTVSAEDGAIARIIEEIAAV